jgi:hypothetical protein
MVAMKRVLVLCSLSLLMGACGSSKKGDFKNLTYETGETVNGVKCSTGRQTAADVKVFCQVLGDDTLNKNCAADMRLKLQSAYNCSNTTPVTVASYIFKEGKCSTGNVSHVDSKEALCEALKNDKLNRDCARDARLKKSRELGC